jgi:hypothetical protein
MKQIQAKSIWINGEEKNAEFINVVSIYDDLFSRAIFHYQLLTIEQLELAKGNVDISDENYLLWGTANDINLSAYEYVTTKLNLVLA